MNLKPDFSELTNRRAIIGRSISVVCGKRAAALTPQDTEQLHKWGQELRTIEERIGSTFDERHRQAFERIIHRQELRPDESTAMAESQYRGTRMHYRGGQLVSTHLEFRATVGVEGTPSGGAYPGSTGGSFVPLEFIKQIMSAAAFQTPWFDIADVLISTTGAPVVWSADNDLAVSAAPIAEAGGDSSADINLVSTVLGSYRYTSKIVKVSNETMTDTGIDMSAYLAGRFAKRMMRGLSPLFTNGVGTTQPKGALNGLTASVTAVGAGGNDGSSAANTIGSDDVASLELALDPEYRPNAKFMTHPNTLAALRKVKDKQGRPVFEGLNRPEGLVLFGYPVVLNPSMDQLQSAPSSPTVTKTTLAFGDWSYYKVRLVQPTLIRLDELFAANAQTGFLLNWRTDAALVDGASSNRAVVTLQNVY
jgi:HK97 family phage major capsid protein